jgi:hypothetical protein
MDFLFDNFDCNDPRSIRALTTAHVVGVWREHARCETPWSAMTLDDRPGRIRPIVCALLDLSGGLYSADRQRNVRLTAAQHAAFRRAQACSERVVVDDFTLVRMSLKLALLRLGVSTGLARQFIRCLLPDWRLARRTAVECHRNGAFGRTRYIDTSFD